MVFLFVLITFEPILDVFFRIWTNSEIQNGGPRWPPLKNDCAIITSCGVVTSWCGRQRRPFQTYYLPSKSRCHSVNIRGVTQGWAESPPPLPSNRVKYQNPALWCRWGGLHPSPPGYRPALASLMEINISLDAQNIPYVFGGDLIWVIVHCVSTVETKQLEHERACSPERLKCHLAAKDNNILKF